MAQHTYRDPISDIIPTSISCGRKGTENSLEAEETGLVGRLRLCRKAATRLLAAGSPQRNDT